MQGGPRYDVEYRVIHTDGTVHWVQAKGRVFFITEGAQIRKILDHIGVDSEPSHISPARGPPLWNGGGDAQMGEGVEVEPYWDLAAQPAPDFDADQRVS